MLSGTRVRLRAPTDADMPTLHAGLYEDVATRARADSKAWRPIAAGPDSPYAIGKRAAGFSVIEIVSGDLAGEALLWGLDEHNRLGHLGMSLLPDFRGRGLATDVIRVLCRYGFSIRGLHRLQLETLADNAAMIATAQACGFIREGTLRENAWVDGQFHDEAIFGLLAADWQAD